MRKIKIISCLVMCTISLFAASVTYASNDSIDGDYDKYEDIKNGNSTDIGDYDWTEEEEQTQTFYREKSQFRSSFEYEEYCEEMYRLGYMDSNYEWISSAKDYINNMTQSSFDILDADAKEIIAQRIENGEIEPEDNPYLTYDERQELIKEKEEENNNQENNVEESNNDENKVNEDKENKDESKNNEENDVIEENNKQSEQKNAVSDMFSKVIMLIFALVIIIGAVYIYKKQII